MNRTERVEDLRATVDAAVVELETSMANGVSKTFLDALEVWSRFRQYSFFNGILIRSQFPTAQQVAGYRKWEQLGFHVKAGEKAIWILGPILRKVIDEDTGEPELRLVGYTSVCVFDISQTAEWPNKQLPEPMIPASGADWERLYADWQYLLNDKHGITVREVPMDMGTYGSATPTTIRINAHKPIGQKASTLVHELAHIVAGHHQADKDRRLRELEAELSAYVVLRTMGAEHPSASDYLLQYRVEPGELRGSMEFVGQVVKKIREMLLLDVIVVETELAEAA